MVAKLIQILLAIKLTFSINRFIRKYNYKIEKQSMRYIDIERGVEREMGERELF